MEMQEKQKPGLEIPWIVTALAEEILRKKGAQTEGIFRVPGDSDAVNNLKVALDKFQMKDTYAEPHVPASALKLWFRELQEPLIAEEYYENCIGAANDADMAVATLELLPELNRKLLLYIIRFLQVRFYPCGVTTLLVYVCVCAHRIGIVPRRTCVTVQCNNQP